jgi:hypothetical protein
MRNRDGLEARGLRVLLSEDDSSWIGGVVEVGIDELAGNGAEFFGMLAEVGKEVLFFLGSSGRRILATV